MNPCMNAALGGLVAGKGEQGAAAVTSANGSAWPEALEEEKASTFKPLKCAGP